jgi:transforming growth factor-beta-induced protein
VDTSSDCKTIAEVACGDGSGFSNLCAAVKRAGLADTLDDKHARFTVFAPTDKAFADFLDGTKLNDVPIKTLKEVLLTHVVIDRLKFKSDLRNRCSDLLEMASGKDTRTICKNDKSDIFQKGGGNPDNRRPEIVDFDNKACNGVIHVINRVIIPG